MIVEGDPSEMSTISFVDDMYGSRIQVNEALKDVESATPLTDQTLKSSFDPFKDRQTDNPTTDCQTLIHLLKSTLGTGIMSMPYAFKSAGVVGGVLGGVTLAAAGTHASYILIKSAHLLYHKTRRTKMDYADVAEAAFATGPKWGRKFAKFFRYFVKIWIFLTYFGACSADNIVIADNFGQVYNYYVNGASGGVDSVITYETDKDLKRIIMACLIPPLILFIWVPDLKYLAPISAIANVFMVCVLGITFYHFHPLSNIEVSLTRSATEFPTFFATTLFAMANIGVIMPLENDMKTPQNFLGTCGVLNRGMFSVTIIYILLGVFGYMKYGEDVQPVITTNLPVDHISAQIAKVLIAATILFTWSLQFYVCREMVWSAVEKYFPKKPRLAEYTIRAMLVVACVSLSISVPTIAPLMQLVGALGFSLLGMVVPVVIEVITFWDIGFGRFNWIFYKAVIFVVIGLLGLFFGSKDAIEEIAKKM